MDELLDLTKLKLIDDEDIDEGINESIVDTVTFPELLGEVDFDQACTEWESSHNQHK